MLLNIFLICIEEVVDQLIDMVVCFGTGDKGEGKRAGHLHRLRKSSQLIEKCLCFNWNIDDLWQRYLIKEVFDQLIDIAVCFGTVGYYYSSSKVKERGAGHSHRLQKSSQLIKSVFVSTETLMIRGSLSYCALSRVWEAINFLINIVDYFGTGESLEVEGK